MKNALTRIGMACALILTGCGGRPAPHNRGATAGAASKPAPSAEGGGSSGVLFQDDFSKPAGSWLEYHGKVLVAEHVDGRYRLWKNLDAMPYTSVSSASGHDFADVRVEVSATRIAGTADNVVGLFCRKTTGGGYSSYFADIDGEGEARLGKYVGGHQTILTEEDGAPLFATGTKKLILICERDHLSFYLDGTMILAAQDNNLRHGDVGLSAGGAGSGTIDVLFDDFVVRTPSPVR